MAALIGVGCGYWYPLLSQSWSQSKYMEALLSETSRLPLQSIKRGVRAASTSMGILASKKEVLGRFGHEGYELRRGS